MTTKHFPSLMRKSAPILVADEDGWFPATKDTCFPGCSPLSRTPSFLCVSMVRQVSANVLSNSNGKKEIES